MVRTFLGSRSSPVIYAVHVKENTLRFDLFISYATSDGLAFATAVADFLKQKYLLSVYLAERATHPGEAIDDKIKEAMGLSHKVLFLFTPDAIKSDWVQGEVVIALALKKSLVICRREDVDKNELPVRLMRKEHIVFENDKKLMESLDNTLNWGIPVIIPAAGRSGGLYPMNLGMPKIILPVGDRPILHHIVQKLDQTVFSRIIILTEMFSDMIEYFAGLSGVSIPIQCMKTPNRKLPMALKELGLETTFLIHYSDILIEGDFNWGQMLEHHKYHKSHHNVIGTLMASDKYNIPVGRIQTGRQQMITKFTEKPDNLESVGYNMNSINMAVSIFEPDFLKHIDENDLSLYGDSLKRAMEEEKKFCIYQHDTWRHIQTLGDWFEAQKHYVPWDEVSFLREVTSANN